MSTSQLSDDWVLCPNTKSLLSWTTSISRTRLSTADGLSFSESFDPGALTSLESLLLTVQQLKLKKFPADELEETRHIASGETFAVSECQYGGGVIAVKRIRLDGEGTKLRHKHFQRRLQAVLREICIMSHPPLAHHPNIISLLGYGWSIEAQRLSPFISVEFASEGTLRDFMKRAKRPLRTKLILAGDVGAGLIALHKCGIVHGDLKMDNAVVFSSLERPCMSVAKVSDFGHAILTGSEREKRPRYYGTMLYNAPEVARQKHHQIPLDQLHKCDIWAFGLCMWEILGDGARYLQESWLQDPLYKRSSASSTAWESISSSWDVCDENIPHSNGQHIFETFDSAHLRTLACQFVEDMRLFGFEKGFLIPLFKRTLDPDPAERMSDLNRLPIIGFWNDTPDGLSLQSKLATYTISGAIRYAMFNKEDGSHIPWDQQQQLLQDFQAAALQPQSQKSDNAAAFQGMLCYLNSFGTSRNYENAADMLCKAKGAGHPAAQFLGPRLLHALSRDAPDPEETYSECLARGFRVVDEIGESSTVTLHDGAQIAEFSDYTAFRDYFFPKDSRQVKPDCFVTLGASATRLSLMDVAIRHDDLEFIDILIPALLHELDKPNSKGELPLIQAARRGNLGIVKTLLKTDTSSTKTIVGLLLHWFFCFEKESVDGIKHMLRDSNDYLFDATALNRPSVKIFNVHPQWPFEVRGTPLATAIESGSVIAVKALLALGAEPLGPVFAADEGETASDWTPIHLAVRHHLPEVLKLLWEAAFGQFQGNLPVTNTPALNRFPVACALCLSTNAERLAMNGNRHIDNLHYTVRLLSRELLLQVSREGKTAISQAIDLEDVDAVKCLLDYTPDLAYTVLKDPENTTSFTFPLHFAVQVGSSRETEESLQIVKYILQHDPTAIDRRDSSWLKPIHIASMGSSSHIVEYLLDVGASVHDADENGRHPLYFCRFPSNAKALLRMGAEINHYDTTGFSAAQSATSRGVEEVLQVLISAGAELDFHCDDRTPLLHLAVRRKSRSIIDILLKAGAPIDALESGQTPLRLAIEVGRLDLAMLLLDRGADPYVEDMMGISPFRVAFASGNPSLLAKMLKHKNFESLSEEKRLRTLRFAATSGEPASLREYLRHLSGGSSTLKDGLACAINDAAAAGRQDLVEVFLSNGAEVDALDSHGNTPLISACQVGALQSSLSSQQRLNLCEMLLTKGANVLARNELGLSALSIAIPNEDFQLLTLLLQHNISLHREGSDRAEERVRDLLLALYQPDTDKRLLDHATSLLGGVTIELPLLQKAAVDNQYDFLMTCIAAPLVAAEDVKKLLDVADRWGPDLLRMYSTRKDWNMVRYLLKGRVAEVDRGDELRTERLESRVKIQTLLHSALGMEFPLIVRRARELSQDRRTYLESPDSDNGTASDDGSISNDNQNYCV